MIKVRLVAQENFCKAKMFPFNCKRIAKIGRILSRMIYLDGLSERNRISLQRNEANG